LQEKAKEAIKELVVAEQKYTQTAQQVEQDRQARIKEEQLRAQETQKQLAMEQAKRDALKERIKALFWLSWKQNVNLD
jgi:hypothetical protein